ncbi:MAG: hypothetical protein V8T36_12580 [Ruthenibacterium lactatiformans]
MLDCLPAGGKLLVCGNGGSAADSLHIVGELMKGFVLPRTLSGLAAGAVACGLSGIAEYCIANLQEGSAGDQPGNEPALIDGLCQRSVAGSCLCPAGAGQGGQEMCCWPSPPRQFTNVLYAAGVAHALGIQVIGLTGQTGGKLAALCDMCIVPIRPI